MALSTTRTSLLSMGMPGRSSRDMSRMGSMTSLMSGENCYDEDVEARALGGAVFRILDVNGDGAICAAEFVAAQEVMLGSTKSGSPEGDLATEADNQDPSAEQQAQDERPSAQEKETKDNVFGGMDANNDEMVDAGEWHTFCTRLYDTVGRARFISLASAWVDRLAAWRPTRQVSPKLAADDWFNILQSLDSRCNTPQGRGSSKSGISSKNSTGQHFGPQDYSLIAEAAAVAAAEAAAAAKEAKILFCYDLEQANPENQTARHLDPDFVKSLTKLINAKPKPVNVDSDELSFVRSAAEMSLLETEDNAEDLAEGADGSGGKQSPKRRQQRSKGRRRGNGEDQEGESDVSAGPSESDDEASVTSKGKSLSPKPGRRGRPTAVGTSQLGPGTQKDSFQNTGAVVKEVRERKAVEQPVTSLDELWELMTSRHQISTRLEVTEFISHVMTSRKGGLDAMHFQSVPQDGVDPNAKPLSTSGSQLEHLCLMVMENTDVSEADVRKDLEVMADVLTDADAHHHSSTNDSHMGRVQFKRIITMLSKVLCIEEPNVICALSWAVTGWFEMTDKLAELVVNYALLKSTRRRIANDAGLLQTKLTYEHFERLCYCSQLIDVEAQTGLPMYRAGAIFMEVVRKMPEILKERATKTGGLNRTKRVATVELNKAEFEAAKAEGVKGIIGRTELSILIDCLWVAMPRGAGFTGPLHMLLTMLSRLEPKRGPMCGVVAH